MSAAAIATMTRALHPSDTALLLHALTTLGATGHPVFVADNSSLPEFLTGLDKVPNVHVRREGANLVQQVKAATARAAASGAPLLIYTEPDKQGFFQNGLAAFIEAARAPSAPAVTIAARDDASFATFPPGQRFTEAAFNQLAAGFLEIAADLLYGPLAFRLPLVLPFLEDLTDDLGWGWRPCLIARILQAGHPVAVHTQYFPCPEHQRGEDDHASRLHRLRQMADNVIGLHRGLAGLL